MIRRGRHSGLGKQGFTLVEVLVTLALMGIVLPVVMRGIQVATAASSYARNAAEAATLGQSKLSEIIAAVQIEQSNTLGSSGDFGPQWPSYSWTYEEMYNSELAVIEVSLYVHWTERGTPRVLRIPTIIVDSVAVEDAAAAAAAAVQ